MALSDIEVARIKRVLVEAGFPPGDVAWMVESCPDVGTARAYYDDRPGYFTKRIVPLIVEARKGE